ncbi:MAG: 2Fe-2S iron-sulfur cluster binding domain-containing protein, partial [Burkholderiales bacterium]|nr:2Fe-2S iron-sulfur cluster binding domain-containing protein [Burkholderiales bacterium]
MSHEIRIAGSEVSFGCEADQTLLDAALRAGIELPYSCRKGVCGNCAAVLRAGQVACAAGDAAPPGRMLLCQCRPRSDLTIEPASWRRIDPDARKVFDAKVYRHARAADDVSILTLRLPAGQRARFRAGQYLQVLLDDGSRRCYSMASAPALSDTLELHVRHVAGGRFTARLATLGAGETLRIELP